MKTVDMKVPQQPFYLPALNRLKEFAESLPNTPLMSLIKIEALILLNMRYEPIMMERHLEEHPYILVTKLIEDAYAYLSQWGEIISIESQPTKILNRENQSMETEHQKLFQRLWVQFSEQDYKERIERYVYRLKINGLGRPWMEGRSCIDLGSGHGNFAHALIQEGASNVFGLDFGKDSIEYSIKARDRLSINSNKIDFQVGSVYQIPKSDASFDFAIQNGVFHHLDDEDAAIREAYRVLKPGGWFWYYTDGAGAISHNLWDASVYILRQIPQELILSHLNYLNIQTGKKYHLGDGLNAIYRHTTWEEITGRLKRLGFGNIRRLTGGFPTDFDHDVISTDSYGKEKFGEGDLRLLAQKQSG